MATLPLPIVPRTVPLSACAPAPRGNRPAWLKVRFPSGLDLDEPRRLAEAVERIGLRHIVITSVTRDDLPDGGAAIFAETIRQLRERVPGCGIEVLIPDFQGNWDALKTVMDAKPDILNHNMETVPHLYNRVRPKAIYTQSL